MAKRISSLTFTVLLFVQLALPHAAVSSQSAGAQSSNVTLAGTFVAIDLPFSAPEFIEPAPDDALQITTSAVWEPFFEVTLSAEPLKGYAGSQALSPAAELTAMQTALSSLRAAQSPDALPGHSIDFFGQPTASTSNQVRIFLKPLAEEPVIIHEWVTQYEDHNWTLRVSYTPGQDFDAALLDGISVRSLGAASAAAPAALEPLAAPAASADPGTILPTPSWWQGDCDTDYYKKKSGKDAYPLGGSYRGVKACGPRPYFDGAPDVAVQFFPGAWGALEWECVELSMRFMYLAYGVPTYSGNGKDVVAKYSGSRLVQIPNDSVNRAPVAGDVLSYGSTGYGHTSVVAASNVDAAGNGTITIIEQNNSTTGVKTHDVKNWHVYASTLISGWLHDPLTIAVVTPANNAVMQRAGAFDLTWNAVPWANSYRVELVDSAGVKETAATTGTTVVLSADTPGDVYQWRVQAYHDDVFIATSEWRTLYRKFGDLAIQSVTWASATRVTLTWSASIDAPANISGYRVYRNGVLIATTGPTTLTYADNASTARACYTISAYKGAFETASRSTCLVTLPFVAR